ncbi:aldo/keto reductase [Weissella tructae]|uniref:2,5-diketo-D-gluconic acid reductase n=2 Tax=Weissella TaxID=46255 RepID=A0A075U0X1_9LACO|nr:MULTISPECIES: aldo/keto reductase [Weissella]AIG66195.1 2,5-diketo-D-gluconic acid reductase [Weissella tructae]AIM63577.1 2,5-diketo-D-gluconic acid reductase [Weissella ceti]AIM64912.1 2,5-diketo-D-gluconic acid reductase [Weissella ceti]ELA07566.1 aldo/keto reductase family protein [Weissella ceti NC36]QVV91342.1 aldo/keto reductase [Weissella tructae]
MINSLQDTITLNNDVEMPGLGLGVFQIPDEDTAEVVASSIENGYRLIDTAQIYGNEAGVGEGIKLGLAKTGLNREDLFITSKVWNFGMSKEDAIASVEASLEKLQLDYVDLFLIHWPGDKQYKDAWLGLEELYAAGKIKAIGVSNFQPHHLEDLLSYAKVVPVLNQVELHPKLSQRDLQAFGAEHGIKTQAWSPLMQGQILDNEVIGELAAKYNKTPAQIVLRWDIQRDVMLVVKSVKTSRLLSNADVFDFELSADDMEMLYNLNEDLRVGPHPDVFNV